MKLPLFLLLAFLACTGASGQSCKFAPADCPSNGVEDYGTTDDSTSRMANPLLPREVTMENRLRRWTASVMQRIAAKEGWQVYQLSETAASGFRAPDQSVLAYDLRPPHWIYITWECIVHTDSLRAWQTWLTEFSRQRLDAVNQSSTRAVAAYDRAKPYQDSAQYYLQLMGQYMTDHMAQYQKDLLAGNKTGTNIYEKAVAGYQKRSDYFTQKAAGIQKDPAAENSAADAESERKLQTIRFRDATLLIVEFGFNMDYAKTAGSLIAPYTSTTTLHTTPTTTLNTAPTTSPHTSTASPHTPSSPASTPLWFTNADPDPIAIDVFARSHSSVLWLLGEWNRKADAYGGYRPAFEGVRPSIDESTPKRIKCDQVQTIDCHISGNTQAIHRLLADLPREELTALIANP